MTFTRQSIDGLVEAVGKFMEANGLPTGAVRITSAADMVSVSQFIGRQTDGERDVEIVVSPPHRM